MTAGGCVATPTGRPTAPVEWGWWLTTVDAPETPTNVLLFGSES